MPRPVAAAWMSSLIGAVLKYREAIFWMAVFAIVAAIVARPIGVASPRIASPSETTAARSADARTADPRTPQRSNPAAWGWLAVAVVIGASTGWAVWSSTPKIAWLWLGTVITSLMVIRLRPAWLPLDPIVIFPPLLIWAALGIAGAALYEDVAAGRRAAPRPLWKPRIAWVWIASGAACLFGPFLLAYALRIRHGVKA